MVEGLGTRVQAITVKCKLVQPGVLWLPNELETDGTDMLVSLIPLTQPGAGQSVPGSLGSLGPAHSQPGSPCTEWNEISSGMEWSMMRQVHKIQKIPL